MKFPGMRGDRLNYFFCSPVAVVGDCNPFPGEHTCSDRDAVDASEMKIVAEVAFRAYADMGRIIEAFIGTPCCQGRMFSKNTPLAYRETIRTDHKPYRPQEIAVAAFEFLAISVRIHILAQTSDLCRQAIGKAADPVE